MKLSLLCAVVFLFSSVSAQTDQRSGKKDPVSVINVQKVARDQIIYLVRVTDPEFPLENLVNEFRSKSGILSAQQTAGGIEVATQSDIDRTMMIGIVKAAGFRNTYNTYKLELRAAVPQPERRTEDR